MATLSVVDGPSEGLKFALGQNNLVMVGRNHDASFQILDGRISRNHLQIKRNGDGEGHTAIDFRSANGVYVNDQRISQETLLADGDVIRIGDSSIVYTTKDDPDARTVIELMRLHGQGRCQTELDTTNRQSD